MTRISRRNATAIAIVGAVAVSAYLVVWSRVDRLHVGLSDFTATYVGATLLRDGHRADLYDDTLQRPLHDSLIAPAREPNLPFVVPPTGAVPALPLVGLDLASAYRMFGLLQLALLGGAAAIAAAPRRGRERALAAALVGLAGLATLPLLILGQIDGLLALGLAVSYRLLARGRDLAGGLALGVTAAVSKPHLFLGVAAFLLGWRRGRVLAGAAAGAALMLLVDVALVGPAGIQGLVAADSRDAGLWPLASLLGWNGLAGSWLGDGSPAQVVAGAADVVALGVCAAIGDATRRRPERLDAGFGAATVLSLLASPHLLAHDLVLLAPVMTWCLVAAERIDGEAWPGRWAGRLLIGWVVLMVLVALDLGNQSAAPPGRVVPLGLLAAGLLGWRALAVQKPAVSPA